MFNRLLQATTITFLLYILVHASPPKANQSAAVPPTKTLTQFVLSLRR
ncbi:MAG: hypothetical protein ABI417_11570 [Coleofasciculaceae cyanobacterium]